MSEYTAEQLDEFYQTALTLVDEAGKLVVSAIDDRDKKISEKASPVDLVTETDKAVEELILSGLRYATLGWPLKSRIMANHACQLSHDKF